MKLLILLFLSSCCVFYGCHAGANVSNTANQSKNVSWRSKMVMALFLHRIRFIFLKIRFIFFKDSQNKSNDTKESYGACKKRTTKVSEPFKDLNSDCKLLILEQLNFADLLSMVQVNQELAHLAIGVFRQKYSDKQFIIENYLPKESFGGGNKIGLGNFGKLGSGFIPKMLGKLAHLKEEDDEEEEIEEEKDEPTHFEYSDRIEISNFEMSLKTLKYFGKRIQKLQLLIADTEFSQSKQIMQYVNRFCSESLVEIEFDVWRGQTLHHITNSFRNVEHVSFHGSIPQMALALNVTFPALQKLTFKSARGHTGYINSYFPYLEHISLSANILSSIDEFLAINSHIQSVYLAESPPNFLEKLNLLLPNLKNLTFAQLNIHDGQIRFENVQTLTLEDSYSSPQNLLCPNLRELVVNLRTERYDNWIHFLKNHPFLTKLYLNSFDTTKEQFQTITADLPNLVEMSISSWNSVGIDANTIVEFLENHSELKRFHMDLFVGKDEEILRRKIDPQWTITNVKFGLVFERNN